MIKTPINPKRSSMSFEDNLKYHKLYPKAIDINILQ